MTDERSPAPIVTLHRNLGLVPAEMAKSPALGSCPYVRQVAARGDLCADVRGAVVLGMEKFVALLLVGSAVSYLQALEPDES